MGIRFIPYLQKPKRGIVYVNSAIKTKDKRDKRLFCCCAIPYCSAGTHKSHHEKFVIVYSNLDFWKKYESFVKKMKKMRIFVGAQEGAMESGWYHQTYSTTL